MLSVILSLAYAFMILKVVFMLVSCFKIDFEGCMSLLHSELILACWVKVLHISWVLQIGWVVDCPYSLDLMNRVTFGDEYSQGGDIVIPRTSKCVSKSKISKFWKFPCWQSKCKTEDYTGRFPYHSPWWRPSWWLKEVTRWSDQNGRHHVPWSSKRTVVPPVQMSATSKFQDSPIRQVNTRRFAHHVPLWCPWWGLPKSPSDFPKINFKCHHNDTVHGPYSSIRDVVLTVLLCL